MTDEQHEAILDGEASAWWAAEVDEPFYDRNLSAVIRIDARMSEACPCRCHHPSLYRSARHLCPVCLCGWS